MLKFYTTFFLTMLLINGYCQNSGQVKSTNEQGYWIFGLNGGLSYQSSDIKALYNGWGFGATLGKNLYYQSGAPISFDLRGRLLFARNYGLDSQRSFDIDNNPVLNGTLGLDYLNYPTELSESAGFVFQNNRTDIGELALEGVLTLNRLRENTGIVVSLFGGIGLDWYRTKTDQADANGRPYYEGYSAINTNDSKSAIRSDLEAAILDGNYESLADEFDSGGKVGFMPSLGVEIGYEFTPRFSMHLGHRATFSGTNLLDGQQWADTQNDVYHYTNLALRWKLSGGTRKSIAGPKIEILRPFENSITSSNPRENIRAKVSGVNGPTDIVCRINGRPVSFDYREGIVEVSPFLESGQNEFDISARNSAGSDQKSIRIFYQGDVVTPPPPPPSLGRPNVVLTNPPRNSYTSNTESFQVKASIEEVSNKSDVKFYLNGRQVNDFRFYGNTGSFQANIQLNKGANDIEIKASNRAGSDLAEAKIYFEERQNLPTVSITTPQRDPVETDRSTATINATIKNINTKSDITLVVNGRTNRDFSYNTSRETFQAQVNLLEGRNQIEITARNGDGEASDRVEINYRKVQQTKQPPVVRITTPEKNTTTSKSDARIEARIDYVNSKNDVQFYLNGRREYGFNYSSQNGRLSHNISLLQGENDILIKVFNQDGQDEARVSIRRLGDIQLDLPPTVRINRPTNNSETDNQTVSLRAEAKNVKNKNEITLLLNNRTISNFSFNTSNKILTASLNLNPGNNTIEVKARTSAGQANDQVNVNYQSAQAPVVRISRPTNNSETNNQTVSLRAEAKNVSNKNEITLLLNNRTISNFSFNTSNKIITASLNLNSGNNTIEVKAQTNGGQASDRVSVSYRSVQPPVVRITSPANNSTSGQINTNLRATVKEVNRKQDIVLTVNGRQISDFQFNASTDLLNAQIQLRAGNNQIKIVANNSDGKDEASINVKYNAPTPPQIVWESPKSNSIIKENKVSIRAQIKNVSNKSGIQLLFNGNKTTKFTYNNGRLTATLSPLKKGSNQIEIIAQNDDGRDNKKVSITYRPEVAQPKPVVKFQKPAKPGSTVTASKLVISASVEHVSGKNDITLLINGKEQKNFNYNAKLKKIEADIVLKGGKNSIEITAKNAVGTSNANTTVTYKITRVKLPEVNFESVSQPTINPLNPQIGRSSVIATIKNVTGKNQITFKVNGSANQSFTFDAKIMRLQATVNLVQGVNKITIRAENRSGADEKTYEITF